MSKNCPIMQRMKENYEIRSRHYLTRRTPVILRIDGKAFHTYTRGLDKPFDEGLIEDMIETTKYLCSKIQGAKCGYVQSDEISILLTDYDNLTTSAWFDYEVQKMCSIAASYAASKFNQLRMLRESRKETDIHADTGCEIGYVLWWNQIDKFTLADFDCRAANYPKEEVVNYFLARQKDATKNSVNMLAQSLYSHKELHGKNRNDRQEMCFQKGINWNDLHYSKKRGTLVTKEVIHYFDDESIVVKEGTITDDELGRIVSESSNIITRSKWSAVETPITFTEEHFKQWL